MKDRAAAAARTKRAARNVSPACQVAPIESAAAAAASDKAAVSISDGNRWKNGNVVPSKARKGLREGGPRTRGVRVRLGEANVASERARGAANYAVLFFLHLPIGDGRE